MQKTKPLRISRRPEFKEWHRYLRENQRVFNAHPKTTELGAEQWNTIAWNLAWIIVEHEDELTKPAKRKAA